MPDGLKVGLQLPQWGPGATREPVLRIAREAEAAGFDSIWVSDHLVYPTGGAATYPYSESGEPPFKPEDGYLEALAMLGVVAGGTERIRLGTSVLILPMRPLLLTAKMLTTLDVLSGGRLLLAISTGWWRAEFEALGADFDRRGAVLDAQLAALDELWTCGRGRAIGPDLAFPEVIAEPRPLQAGGPEIWIGGHGPRVWRRIAGTRAAGWHGVGYRPSAFIEARQAIEVACAAAGRDPGSVRMSTATGLPLDAGRLRERMASLSEAGAGQVVFIPRSDSVDMILRAIELYAEARTAGT